MKPKSKFKQALRILVLASLSILLIWCTVPKVKSILDLQQQKCQLEQEKTKLQKENKELNKDLKDLDSPQAVEKLAREQLGMVKKGEKFIQPLTQDKP